jgi:hypothetical protein
MFLAGAYAFGIDQLIDRISLYPSNECSSFSKHDPTGLQQRLDLLYSFGYIGSNRRCCNLENLENWFFILTKDFSC